MGGSAADAIRSVAIVASRAASNARWRPVPALVLIACGSGGCGRIFFEPHRSDGDASTDDVAVADAAGTCDSQAPFGAPRLISELSDLGALDGTLRLMPDELTGYMWSYTQRADGDLYYVTRSALDLPFTMTRVTSVSTASQELDPTFTSDGSMVVFRRSGPGDDLYVAPISAPGVLGTVTPINAVNGASTEAQPFMPLGRNELYFQSTRTMAGDIYISTWSGGTTFSTPTLVAGLATPSVEGDPVVTGDGLTIYYRSDAPAAIARFNIYVATRASTTDPFGAPQLVPNVNTPADDGPSWISPNGCRLYISSDLGGTNDIYVSTRGL
jgi:Tol biopolymer transport system component